MTSGSSYSHGCDSKLDQISKDMDSDNNIGSLTELCHDTKNESLITKNAEIDRIRISEANTDRLKIAIYMEAANVYRGRGVEKRFADYLDGLGRYLSLDTSVRSNCDVATNGINNVLQVFLTTKKLRKLHNLYVKALMGQCLRTKISRERSECHIPFQWRRMIKFCKTETDNKNPSSRLPESQDKMITYIESNFGCNSIVWRQTDTARLRPSTFTTQSSLHNLSHIHFDENQSSRIPGVLEIDHIAHQAIENEEYCLSQSALWAISIAVKEYVSKILMDITTHFDSQNNDDVSRKTRCLSCYDIMQVIDAKVKSNETTDLRVAWEQLVSNACLTIPTGMSSNLISETEKMNSKIVERAQHAILNHQDGKYLAHDTLS
jgi:hypothetical protein